MTDDFWTEDDNLAPELQKFEPSKRIRKPKFPKGEWVRNKKLGTTVRAYDTVDFNNFERWVPRPGELCVFWDKEQEDDIRFVIAKLEIVDTIQNPPKYEEKHSYYGQYEHCAPIEFAKEIADGQHR